MSTEMSMKFEADVLLRRTSSSSYEIGLDLTFPIPLALCLRYLRSESSWS